MRRLFALMVLFVGTVVGGCSTLPPAKPVQDIKSIAGIWEGTMTLGVSQFGSVTRGATWIIKEDGSYVMITPREKGAGTVHITNGMIRFADGPRLSGIAYLYEGEGKRVLISWHDDLSVSGGWTPAK